MLFSLLLAWILIFLFCGETTFALLLVVMAFILYA